MRLRPRRPELGTELWPSCGSVRPSCGRVPSCAGQLVRTGRFFPRRSQQQKQRSKRCCRHRRRPAGEPEARTEGACLLRRTRFPVVHLP
eukprot:COSAG04_NODE_16232_length_506_cov_0.498771_1_plen_88_part_10